MRIEATPSHLISVGPWGIYMDSHECLSDGGAAGPNFGSVWWLGVCLTSTVVVETWEVFFARKVEVHLKSWKYWGSIHLWEWLRSVEEHKLIWCKYSNTEFSVHFSCAWYRFVARWTSLKMILKISKNIGSHNMLCWITALQMPFPVTFQRRWPYSVCSETFSGQCCILGSLWSSLPPILHSVSWQ